MTQSRLVSSYNPKGDVPINYLELGALLVQILIFTPRMAPLAHIHTYVDNTAAQGWDNLGSVNTASAVGPILQEIALAVRCQKIHAYVGCITGEKKKMVDAMSRLTHLTDHKSLSHFSHTSRISSLGVCPPCRWNAGSS